MGRRKRPEESRDAVIHMASLRGAKMEERRGLTWLEMDLLCEIPKGHRNRLHDKKGGSEAMKDE